jgi:ADP-ribosylglycohydrolase
LKGLIAPDNYKNNCIKEYIKLYNKHSEKKLYENYFPTNNYVESLQSLVKNEIITYDSKYNESMVLSRVVPFGLLFWKKEQRSKLITEIIENISITHKNNIAYLSGITLGLFISFKKNGIDAYKWGYKLTEYLLSNEFDNIIKENKMYNTKFILDKEDYVSMWNAYLDSSFKNDKYVLKPEMMNPSYRANFLFLTFNEPNTNEFVYGLRTEECMIIAYDSLLYCDGYFEKMFIVGALGITNNSVMGSICGILFGVEYGINNSINKNIFKNETWLKKLLILTKNINI